MKKNRLCHGCYAEILPKHTKRSCTNRRISKVYPGKHPTGLYGYNTTNKISPNQAKIDDKNETGTKNSCAGIGNAATKLREVKSICDVSV